MVTEGWVLLGDPERRVVFATGSVCVPRGRARVAWIAARIGLRFPAAFHNATQKLTEGVPIRALGGKMISCRGGRQRRVSSIRRFVLKTSVVE